MDSGQGFFERLMSGFTLFLSLVLFGVGGMIYILFRSLSLKMFSWFEFLGWMNHIHRFRGEVQHWELPMWVKFALPDGLWVLSYILLIGCIWNFDYPKAKGVMFLLPLIAINSELLQAINVVKGTFDSVDLLCYSGATLVGWLYVYGVKNKIILT